MARLIWTSEMDETVRQMEADGKSDAEICEALGIEKARLKNRRCYLKYAERKNGATESPETEGIRDELEAGQRSLSPDETTLQPAALSPAEQEMARMIEERERMLRVKEAELARVMLEAERLRDELDKKNVQNEKLGQKLAAKDRIIAKMAAEIYGEA